MADKSFSSRLYPQLVLGIQSLAKGKAAPFPLAEKTTGFVQLLLKAEMIRSMDIKSLDIMLSQIEGSSRSSFTPLLAILFCALNRGQTLVEIVQNSTEAPSEALIARQLDDWQKQAVNYGNNLEIDPVLNSEDIHTLSKSFCENWQRGQYSPLFQSSGPLILNPIGLAFRKFSVAENNLAEFLRKKIHSRYTLPPLESFSKAFHAILDQSPLLADNKPVKMNPEQMLALITSVVFPFTLISGGPGTGKTSLVVNLVRLLHRLHDFQATDFLLCAPTGRAATRLQESVFQKLLELQRANPDGKELYGIQNGIQNGIQIEATTVHRMLDYQPVSNRFGYGKNHPLQGKILIVDEVSMLHVDLFAKLMEAAPMEMKVVLLGDSHQLPPVETGAVLHDLVSGWHGRGLAGKLPKELRDYFQNLMGNRLEDELGNWQSDGPGSWLIGLTQNHRSQKEIQKFTQAVQSGNWKICKEYLHSHKSISHFNPGPEAGQMQEKAAEWMFELLSPKPLSLRFSIGYEENPDVSLKPALEYFNRFKILCVLKQGMWGSDKLNGILRSRLFKWLHSSHSPFMNHDLFPGLPIIITRNSPSLNLYNGDTGLIIQRDTSLGAIFDKGESLLYYGLDSLPPFEPSLAITVHKSQGSEYDHVLVVSPGRDHPLLQKEMIYTAVSRAKKSISLLGPEGIFQIAVERKLLRRTGLSKKFAEFNPV